MQFGLLHGFIERKFKTHRCAIKYPNICWNQILFHHQENPHLFGGLVSWPDDGRRPLAHPAFRRFVSICGEKMILPKLAKDKHLLCALRYSNLIKCIFSLRVLVRVLVISITLLIVGGITLLIVGGSSKKPRWSLNFFQMKGCVFWNPNFDVSV